MSEPTEAGAAALADLVRAAKLPPVAERRRIREAAGLSFQRMADALGVTAPTVWNWENDKDGPSLENAARYRKLLDQLDKAVDQ